ncbi:hypothetical protein [Nocardiopsis sp. L17-MgMaSL7]|uniref:hypothetical protein n=1 Tax=Nocardiopsis sp. L17-MgMaSL7 TaxID=1938893 RepID=UPI001F2679FC|nr:hypothetical protein [Nocardiopsis sp. L17-MgMaSL7]
MSDRLPDAWNSGRLLVMLMGMYGIMNTEVEKEDGEALRINPPGKFFPNIMDLRAGMYREGQGTWFSWELQIWSEGTFKSRFNYEDYPPFPFSPDRKDFIDENNLYPRSEEFMPDWLREKIDAAWNRI